MPEIETPGRRVLGTPVPNARKKISFTFTADEIASIIAHLPETWSAPRAKTPYPVRARFIVAWETALRPRTISQLSAPADYRLGATTLQIRDEIDKSRFGRELPLSDAARAALDSACPKNGLIFGDHDCSRFQALGRHAPRPLQRQSAGRDVPARAQAAGHHGPLHAASKGRGARCSSRRLRPGPRPQITSGGRSQPESAP